MGLALPGDLANQHDRQVKLKALVLQTATPIMAQLVPIEFHRAMAQAAHDDDPMGVKPAEEEREVQFALNLHGMAHIAAAAAEALLMRCGLISRDQQ